MGVALATVWFAFSYAQVHITSFAVVPTRSGAVRSAAQVCFNCHRPDPLIATAWPQLLCGKAHSQLHACAVRSSKMCAICF